jgi:hypothetical protein
MDEAGEEADKDQYYEVGALWPRRAAHERDYFPTLWNAMDHGIITYRFRGGSPEVYAPSGGSVQFGF